jgi:hypothetical protein
VPGKARTKSEIFGPGAYEAKPEDGDPQSLVEFRSAFLQEISILAPQVADSLIDLLGLYRQIPLFCFEAAPR